MGLPGSGPFGTTVASEWGELGEDFALVRVDEDKRDLVNPAMCRFGGPVAAAPPGAAGGVDRLYGWGHETRAAEETRGRSGIEVAPPALLLAWQGRVSPGDSGAPVASAAGLAMGVATNWGGLAASPRRIAWDEPEGLRFGFGTPLWRALDIAARAGYAVELIAGST